METDDAGLTTTSSSFKGPQFTLSELVVREGAAGVPEQRKEITYDSNNRVISTKIKEGTAILQQEDRTYDGSGRLETATLNNALLRQYVYSDGSNGGQRVRIYRRPAGTAETNNVLVSDTISDWQGRLVSRSGPGVVEETRIDAAVALGRIQTTTRLGPSASPLVTLVTERNGLGQRTGERISVPNGQWRTRTYHVSGRPETEKINNEIVRSWNYDNGMEIETTTPTPQPTRTRQTQQSYVTDGAHWQSTIIRELGNVSSPTDDSGSESQTMLYGFANANEIAVSRFRDLPNGQWTTVTTTVDPATKTVTEKTARPGIGSQSERKFRAGLLVSEQAHSGVAATTYTYDALGRVLTVAESGRSTTITYDLVFGQAATVNTSGTDGTSSSQSSTYYQPDETTPGRIKTQTVDGQTTNYSWTARGELAATWGPTYPVKYEYDLAGRLWKMRTYQTEPTGDPASWPAGNVTEWVYYPGTMALQIKRDAVTLGATYEYDPRGWVSKRTWARAKAGGGALFAEYAHNRLGELTNINYNDVDTATDKATPDVALSRDEKGRVMGVMDGSGGWTYQYDSFDRMEREINNATNSALIYQRDPQGRRVGYGFWDQNQATGAGSWASWGGWGYDPVTGRINGVSTPEGWISQSYESGTNRPSTVTFGATTSARQYDGLGRLWRTSTSSSNSGHDPDLIREYTYNAANQRNKMTDEDNDFWEYGYNGRNEGTKKRGTSILPYQQFGYSFDAIGNRMTASQYGSQTASRTYNAVNQASGGNNYSSVAIVGQADAAPTTTLTLNAQPIPITNRNGADFGATVVGSNGYYPRWLQ